MKIKFVVAKRTNTDPGGYRRMRDFVITVNSTVDLPREWLEERHVPVFPLKYTIDGETYTDMYGLSAKEFFDKLREGHMSVTSQINPEEAVQMMEPYVKEGKDILIGFNPKFLIDALRVIDDEMVTLYLVNPKAPCFIRDENQTYIYLILPVNFNSASV